MLTDLLAQNFDDLPEAVRKTQLIIPNDYPQLRAALRAEETWMKANNTYCSIKIHADKPSSFSFFSKSKKTDKRVFKGLKRPLYAIWTPALMQTEEPSAQGLFLLSITECGRGGNGRVKKVIDLITGNVWCLKAHDRMDKSEIDITEVYILERLARTPGYFIIDSANNQSKLYIVMDFIDGIPIEDFGLRTPLSLKNRQQNQEEHLYILLALSRAITSEADRLNETHKFLHCDIQGGNIMVPSALVKKINHNQKVVDRDIRVIYIDFGNSLEENEYTIEPIGKIDAPEIRSTYLSHLGKKIKDKLPYSSASDAYCVGIVLDRLFDNNTTEEDLVPPIRSTLGLLLEKAKTIIMDLLIEDPAQRCTLKDASGRFSLLIGQLINPSASQSTLVAPAGLMKKQPVYTPFLPQYMASIPSPLSGLKSLCQTPPPTASNGAGSDNKEASSMLPSSLRALVRK